ncbi:MAG: ferritin family protein [Candidatus Omnitrophica bacterium]|nr:ferritin family protein [Candidatus Omnitrophota bacterium]
MSNVFNITEVIDMGIEKEKKRRDFYGRVSESFKEDDMKKLFARLRDWEDEHIKKFAAIRDTVNIDESQESYKGELAEYMRALVDDILYSQVSEKEFTRNVKSPKAAIQYGIGFEKDAILFFNELLKYMEPIHTEKVRILIEEEKKHIIYLAQLRKKYDQ